MSDKSKTLVQRLKQFDEMITQDKPMMVTRFRVASDGTLVRDRRLMKISELMKEKACGDYDDVIE